MFYFHNVVYVQYLGEVDIFHTWVKNVFFLIYNTAKNYKKSIEIFQSYDHKCPATFLWFTVYSYLFIYLLLRSYIKYTHRENEKMNK